MTETLLNLLTLVLLALLYLFTFVTLLFTGSGRFAIDRISFN